MPNSVTAQNLADALLRGALAGQRVTITYQPEPAFWGELVWWMQQLTGGFPVEVNVVTLVDGSRLEISRRPDI